jgi:hypothetical protein
MAWKKKFPNLNILLGGANHSGPTVAPVGEGQPALAAASMNQDLKPMAFSGKTLLPPHLKTTPEMDEHLRKKALINIATGKRGF